jgi:hypothetical protein
MTTKTKKRRTTSKVLKEVPKDPNQRAIKKLFPTRKSLRKSLAPTYYPVTDHVYYDGHSFRVRVRIEGKTQSWNTSDKQKALEYRDYQLLARTKRKLLK